MAGRSQSSAGSAKPRLSGNLLASFFGQFWRAVMALVFVPFYVGILGIEAYGLIGLYAGLQLALLLLDVGLRPALAREMARFTGGTMDAAAIRTLLRSVELPLLGAALVIVAIMAVAAPWLALHWVQPQSLTHEAVSEAFMIMGLVAAAQLIENGYDSWLSSLQRQVAQNAIITVMATLRGFGTLAVLWFWPHVSAYFLWQAVVSSLSLTAFAIAVYRSLPPAGIPIHFSLAALRPVRPYALGMLGIATIALLLTQSDKFLLARLVPLAELGHYTLAASLASAMSFLASPVGNAFYPRLTEQIERGESVALAVSFHRASRLITLLTGSAAAMFVLFGEPLLRVWLGNPELAASTAPVLALLALGFLFNALTTPPYLLQLAHGVTWLTLRLNIVLLVLFIPALTVAIQTHGAVGAALCWALLTFTNLTASGFLTFRRFLHTEARRWWIGDVAIRLAVLFGVAAILRGLLPLPHEPMATALVLLAAGAAIFTCGVFADRELSREALRLIRQLLKRMER